MKFTEAVRSRSLEDIITAQQTGEDVNETDQNGYTALHLASGLGLPKIVNALLDIPGIKGDIRCRDNFTPLHMAIRMAKSENHIKVVEALTRHPSVDYNSNAKLGGTPLHCAITFDQKNIFSHLLSLTRIEINKKDLQKYGKKVSGKTPLCLAAIVPHGEWFLDKLLQQPGVRINTGGLDGCTPLSFVTPYYSSSIIRLLKFGAGLFESFKKLGWFDTKKIAEALEMETEVIAKAEILYPYLDGEKTVWLTTSEAFNEKISHDEKDRLREALANELHELEESIVKILSKELRSVPGLYYLRHLEISGLRSNTCPFNVKYPHHTRLNKKKRRQ